MNISQVCPSLNPTPIDHARGQTRGGALEGEIEQGPRLRAAEDEWGSRTAVVSAFRRSVWNRYMASSAHTVLSSVPRHIHCDQTAGAVVRICWTAEGQGGLPKLENTLTATERVTVLGTTLGKASLKSCVGED